MRLEELAADPAAPIDEIATYLDSLDRPNLLEALALTTRQSQRSLYEKASQSPPVTLEDFVGNAPPVTEVVHDGVNTLPLIAPLRHFQKRFCRGANGESELYGYNEGKTRRWIGPGYFVASSTAGHPQWQARGAVVVDYFKVPQGAVPKGWPRVVPNSRGLQRFVFRGTRDFMRRVSNLVTVGAAYRGERPLDHYFVLCRQPGAGQ